MSIHDFVCTGRILYLAFIKQFVVWLIFRNYCCWINLCLNETNRKTKQKTDTSVIKNKAIHSRGILLEWSNSLKISVLSGQDPRLKRGSGQMVEIENRNSTHSCQWNKFRDFSLQSLLISVDEKESNLFGAPHSTRSYFRYLGMPVHVSSVL